MNQDKQENGTAAAPSRTRVFASPATQAWARPRCSSACCPSCARGLSVSLIKHSHKDIEIDRPGKDSYRLREAGCHEVLLLGRQRWALMHELRGADEPPLDYLLDRLQACDLVLVEGFRRRLPQARDLARQAQCGTAGRLLARHHRHRERRTAARASCPG